MKQLIKKIDQLCSRIFLRFVPEKASLIIVLFHGLFLDEREINEDHVDPQQRITIAKFREFCEYYVKKGYAFVSPEDVLSGLTAEKKYIMITFDDGYYNNSYALPALEEFGIPAVFFVSTNNVLRGKCFWWDVLYRERRKRGATPKQIEAEGRQLKSKTADEIEAHLLREFGGDCLKPIGTIDRPFTVAELREFSRNRHVHIGNHTCDHAILTNYSRSGVRQQILNAQLEIYRLTGVKPQIISYPNGSYSREIVRVTRDMGIKMGITIDAKKNYLPINVQNIESVHLGRFILVGDMSIPAQCDVFRSEFSLYNRVKNLVCGTRS